MEPSESIISEKEREEIKKKIEPYKKDLDEIS